MGIGRLDTITIMRHASPSSNENLHHHSLHISEEEERSLDSSTITRSHRHGPSCGASLYLRHDGGSSWPQYFALGNLSACYTVTERRMKVSMRTLEVIPLLHLRCTKLAVGTMLIRVCFHHRFRLQGLNASLIPHRIPLVTLARNNWAARSHRFEEIDHECLASD